MKLLGTMTGTIKLPITTCLSLCRIIFITSLAVCMRLLLPAEAAASPKVIIISYDGLRPDVINTLGKTVLPNFFRVMNEGVFTLNARTDPDMTVTLPNHTSMITGRAVSGDSGHGFRENVYTPGVTIHSSKGSYVPSVFGLLKANGKSSGLFASKVKFQLYIDSYAVNFTAIDESDANTLKSLITKMRSDLPDLSFVHFANSDDIGHSIGWATPEYDKAVVEYDKRLGKILKTVDSTPALSKTLIIITSDHGGEGTHHSEVNNRLHFTVPFIVWQKNVKKKGLDLYELNKKNGRKNPGNKQIATSAKDQPIRNGEAANVAMKALGLPAVEGSSIGKSKPLIIR